MATYRYIRWQITERRLTAVVPSERTDDFETRYIQAADLEMRNGGSAVAWNGSASATNPGGSNPAGEEPFRLLDNDSATKWIDISNGSTGQWTTTLIIDNVTAMTFDGYRYRTANDANARDPVSWTISGSTDGSSWTVLDTRSSATVPGAAFQWTSVFSLPGGTTVALNAAGVGSATGSATLTTTRRLVASGVGSATGSATLASTGTALNASGVGVATGSATLLMQHLLNASGVGGSTGYATMAASTIRPLLAAGVGGAVGTAALSMIRLMTASGVGSGAGTATLTTGIVSIPADAVGVFYDLRYQAGGGYTPGKYNQGSLLLVRCRAKAPVGYTLSLLPGSTGNASTLVPLTTMASTGSYREYLWRHQVGPSGSFDPTGYIVFTGTALGTVDIDVLSVVDIGQASNILGPSLEVTPVPGDTQYQLYYVGTGLIEVSLNNGTFATAGASPITVTRGAAGSAGTVVTFRARGEGQDITDSVTVPSVDADTVTPDLFVTVGTQTATTQQYTVSATNPKTGGASNTLSFTLVGCTAVGYAGVGPHAISNGTTITVTRPVFGAATNGSITFDAGITGGGAGAIGRTVFRREKLVFGPSLSITATPGDPDYTLAWDVGTGVELVRYQRNNNAWVTLTSPPLTGNIAAARPAAGALADVYTFEATADGQVVSNSVTVPAVDADTVTPNLSITTGTATNTYEFYDVQATTPKVGGTNPTATITFASGATVERFNGSAWVGISTPHTVPTPTSVTQYRAARPPFGSIPQFIKFEANIAGGGAESHTRSVRNQDSLPYVTVVLDQFVYTTTTMQFRATATAPGLTPSIRVTALQGTTIASGQTINTTYASGTLITVVRPARIADGEASVKVEGFVTGAVTDADTVLVPAQGQDVQRLQLSMVVTPVSQTQSNCLITVRDANPLTGSVYTVTLTAQGNLTLNDSSTFTLAEGGSKTIAITPPKYTDNTARLTARVTAPGRIADIDSVDIPPRDRATEPTSGAAIEVVSFTATETEAVLSYAWPGSSTASFARLYVQETDAEPIPAVSVAQTGYLTPFSELVRSLGPGSVTIRGMLPGNWITVTAVPYDDINRRGTDNVRKVRLLAGSFLPLALTARAAVTTDTTSATNTVTLPSMPTSNGEGTYRIRTFVGGIQVAETPVSVTAGNPQTIVTSGLASGTSYRLTYALVNDRGQSALTTPLVVTTTTASIDPPTIVRTSADFATNDYAQTATINVAAALGWPSGTTIEIEQTAPTVRTLASGAPGFYDLSFVATIGSPYNVSLRTRGRTPGGVYSSWASLAAFTIPAWSGAY